MNSAEPGEEDGPDRLPTLPADVHDELLAILFGDPRTRDAELGHLLERKGIDTAAVRAHIGFHDARTAHGTDLHIPGYRILCPIGEGGMGTVYEAEQLLPLQRRVAVKVIKFPVGSREVIERFERERQSLALMDHEAIAKVFDCGVTARGQPFFVMELIHGVPIHQHCDQHRLGIKDRLLLMRQVCSAVQHAHQKAVVHRDLKPGNVLVTGDGDARQVKVIDFGLAKVMAPRPGEHSSFTEAGQVVGTPEYMAPEQADPTNVDVDTRADVYSLGMMLYELLVGALPFSGGDGRRLGMLEMQHALREVDPPKPSTRLMSHADRAQQVAALRRTSPSELLRTMKRDLDWLVLKAIEKDRRRRYESADALSADLQRFLHHEPLQAGPPSAGYRLRKLLRRYRVQVVGAGAVVLASATFGGVAAVQYVRAEGKAEEALVAKGRAEASAQEATDRADELEQVLAFQEAQWMEVQPEIMGVRLRRDLLARATAEHRAGLEAGLPGVNFTSLALELLATNLFDRSLAAIEKGFAGQPLVKARLLQTIASQLFELGLRDRAVAPQTEALEIRQALLGEDHLDTMFSTSQMGLQLAAQGRFVESVPLYRALLARCRRIVGPEHRFTLTTLCNLGAMLIEASMLDEAEPVCREALDLERTTRTEARPQKHGALDNMALLRQKQGRLADAESFYRELVDRLQTTYGPEKPETVAAINNLGTTLWEQDKAEEAVTCFREATSAMRRFLGNDHRDTLNAMGNLGLVLMRQGRIEEAESVLHEAIAGKRRALGDDNPDTLASMGNLALLLEAQGRLNEAEPLHRQVLEARRRQFGQSHADTLAATNNYAMVLHAQGKAEAAEPLLRAALEVDEPRLDSAHPITATLWTNLGVVLAAQRKFPEAESCLREALEHDLQLFGDEHVGTQNTIRHLGSLLVQTGRHRAAVDLMSPAEGAARRCLTGNHAFRFGAFLTSLGRAHAALGTPQDRGLAERKLREAYEILVATRGPEHPDASDCAQALVDLYRDWHAAEPDAGHDRRAADWQAKVASPPGK